MTEDETEPDANHVRISSPDGSLVCLHCGAKYTPTMPAPTRVWTAMVRAFVTDHEACTADPVRGVACTMCFAFGHAAECCPALAYGGDPYRWLNGPDCGLSSETIWRQMQGETQARASVPLDSGDFGRCYRLLKAFTAWRTRIGEMRAVAGWGPIVDAWNDLERLHEAKDQAELCRRLMELT